MKRNTEATCATCPCYSPINTKEGECREKSPIPLPDGGSAFWPFVSRYMWCWEHPNIDLEKPQSVEDTVYYAAESITRSANEISENVFMWRQGQK